ncbi:hypothetical protein GUJ93_ZPchr0013g36601 [Zizania palustris]|uniref:Uncharacterized protein n=1 Tax=Zizania palustris TaxID=103762 RepID=A0A8J5X0R4_ZIZPA|nr:hypothetical protein GUJ93_ZPchr0013g36601 [Zizania palustris]
MGDWKQHEKNQDEEGEDGADEGPRTEDGGSSAEVRQEGRGSHVRVTTAMGGGRRGDSRAGGAGLAREDVSAQERRWLRRIDAGDTLATAMAARRREVNERV